MKVVSCRCFLGFHRVGQVGSLETFRDRERSCAVARSAVAGMGRAACTRASGVCVHLRRGDTVSDAFDCVEK